MSDYIKYFNEVLGVEKILLKEESMTQSQAAKIKIFVENYIDATDEEKKLLHNMLAATKIEMSSISIFDFSQKNIDLQNTDSPNADPRNKNLITFDLVHSPQHHDFQTFSPRTLLACKELKSEAWTFLQGIMNKFALMLLNS